METNALEWSVMTWNLQGSKHTDLERVVETIQQESPDLLALQEVRQPQAAELAEALSMTMAWAEKHHAFRPFLRSQAEGAAVLTPHALSGVGHTTISSATWKRSWRRRIVQFATAERSDGTGYRIYNSHLSPHDLASERLDESRRIASLAASHGESPPIIVVGDFNDHGEADVIAALPGIEHVPSLPTSPAQDPVQALDHVVLPAGATNVALTVPGGGPQWNTVSDHLPVTVRFSFDWVQGGFAR